MYNYLEAVTEDVIEYIKDNIDIEDYESRDELFERLLDDCFIDDGVTGNASGSYFFNRYKAEEALCHNMSLVGEAYEEFCDKPNYDDPESMDVTIRCYLLPRAIENALDELGIEY